MDSATGDCGERRLEHREEAERFYRELAAQGMKVRVGMEASGHARWFERLLAELNFELWIGDATVIHAKRVRKPKTDRQDAQLILRLMLKDDFPQIWVPSWENRDLRQLLWHRHRMVPARTRIMNQLQAVAINEGPPLEEEVVAGIGTGTTGGIPVSAMGQPATGGSAEVAGWAEPDDCRADASDRAGSRKMSGGTALADASWSGCTDSPSLRINHRKDGAISVREADRGVFGVSTLGGLKRKSATTGPYHKAREFDIALLAGGSGPSYSAQHSRMAQ